MFGGSPSQEEMKRLRAKLVQMENNMTALQKSLKAERKAKEDARRALRQRAGGQPSQPAATAVGAPAQSQELSELQAVIAAAHAERDDALAAAQAAHADAERAQLREQIKAVELSDVKAQLTDAKQRSEVSQAVLSRAVDADSTERQVKADTTALQNRLDGALSSIHVLEAKLASIKQEASSDAAAMQADYAAVQEQRDQLFAKSSKLVQQVEGLQAALIAKDRRIEDLRSEVAAREAHCNALEINYRELEEECASARKAAASALQEALEGRVAARAAADRASAAELAAAELAAQASQSAAASQEAAAMAKREAQTSAELASQAEARAAALEAARAEEQRKSSILQANLTDLADQCDAKAARIEELEATAADASARLAVMGQVVDAGKRRVGELAEARLALAAKLREVGQMRADLDEERARYATLTQVYNDALADVEEARTEVVALRAASPAKVLRMSRSDSEEYEMMSQQAGDSSWPAADAYLEKRRALNPSSPAAAMHTINQEPTTAGPPTPEMASLKTAAHPMAAAAGSPKAAVLTAPAPSKAAPPPLTQPASPSPASPKPASPKWQLTASPRKAASPAGSPKAFSVRTTPPAVSRSSSLTAADAALAASPRGGMTPRSPALAAAQALFTSPLSRGAADPADAAGFAATLGQPAPPLGRTMSAGSRAAAEFATGLGQPACPLGRRTSTGSRAAEALASYAVEAPDSSPEKSIPSAPSGQAGEASPTASSLGDKENDGEEGEGEFETGETGSVKSAVREGTTEVERIVTRRYALRSKQ